MVVEEREIYTLLKAVSAFLSITLLGEELRPPCRMEQEELMERVDRMLDQMPEYAEARSRLSTMQAKQQQESRSEPVEEPLYDDHLSINTSASQEVRKESTSSASYVAMGGACIAPSTNMGGITETNQHGQPEVYEVPDSTDENVYQVSLEEEYDGIESKEKSKESEDENPDDTSSVIKTTTEHELAYDVLKSRTKELNHFTPAQISEDCSLSGVLYKKKKKFLSTNWHKRLCVVKENFLFYFRSEDDDKEKGVIILPGYNVALFGPSKEKRYGFYLEPRNSKRDYYQFIVGTQEEVKKWLNVLTPLCLQEFKKEDQKEILRRLSTAKLKNKDEQCSSSETSAGEVFPPINNPNDEIYDAIEESSGTNLPTSVGTISGAESLHSIESEVGEEQIEDDDIYDIIPADQEESPQIEERTNHSKREEVSRVTSFKGTAPSLPPPRASTVTHQMKDSDSNANALPESCPSPPLPARNPTNQSLSKTLSLRGDESRGARTTSPPQLLKRINADITPVVEDTTVPADLFSLENVYVGKEDHKEVPNDELSFDKGDIIYIVERSNASWWIGCVDGRVGLVMNKYLIEAFPQ